MFPTRLAIIKCQAHRKGNEDVIRGNNAADEAAVYHPQSRGMVKKNHRNPEGEA